MMGPPLDTWPPRDTSGDAAARERTLAVLRAELARPGAVRPWRTEAARLFAVSVALTAAVTAVAWALGLTSGAHLAARAPLLALLWLTSAVCARASLAPGRKGPRRAGWVLVLGAATALVLARDASPDASSFPAWGCTLSHLGVALLPGAVALAALRGAAFQPGRALLGGLSVGTAGAFVGEIVCTRGPGHVLLYHLPAWALAAVATLVASRFLLPRSFAP